jgi:hypothetical protein
MNSNIHAAIEKSGSRRTLAAIVVDYFPPVLVLIRIAPTHRLYFPQLASVQAGRTNKHDGKQQIERQSHGCNIPSA